jgi:transaldolase
MNELQRLHDLGQSVWLDFLRRSLLLDGTFERMTREWSITGVTSNPTIFASALSSGDYDADIADAAGRVKPLALFYDLALRDIRAAADVLHPIWDATSGRDGFASFELEPGIADDAAASVASAKHLFVRIDRPNVMIKVPGTAAGVRAARELTADGHNVNVTLLFSVRMYERFANAYVEGLETRLAAGHDIHGVASVASFFVSRVDRVVDMALPTESPLRGLAAVANARDAYHCFQRIFSGPGWERIRAAGGRPQRPLWASTGTKDREYSDVKYLEELVAQDTVTTVPEVTLGAFLDHGRAAIAPMDDFDGVLHELRAEGIDLDSIGEQLLLEGIRAFENDMGKLLEHLGGSDPHHPSDSDVEEARAR